MGAFSNSRIDGTSGMLLLKLGQNLKTHHHFTCTHFPVKGKPGTCAHEESKDVQYQVTQLEQLEDQDYEKNTHSQKPYLLTKAGKEWPELEQLIDQGLNHV